MIVLMSRTWWIWALRGASAVLFGLAAFIWPEITLTALALLYGAYALCIGNNRIHGCGKVHKQKFVGLCVGIADDTDSNRL